MRVALDVGLREQPVVHGQRGPRHRDERTYLMRASTSCVRGPDETTKSRTIVARHTLNLYTAMISAFFARQPAPRTR
jgi:hypothetical protein